MDNSCTAGRQTSQDPSRKGQLLMFDDGWEFDYQI
jgi:hypothetical protein